MARPPALQTLDGSNGFPRNMRFLGFLLLLLLLPFAASSAASSIHDLLREHGLPAGIFPKTVRSFSLDAANGLLEVDLDRPCYAKFDNLVYFDRVVRGNLSYGELKGMVGFSQEELFLWLPVKGIQVSDPKSGVILFDIGVAEKRLSLALFEEPHDCKPEGEGPRSLGFASGLSLNPGIRNRGPEEQR